MKICKKCGIEKEYFEYYKDKKSKDGFRGSCKSCMSIYQYNIDREHRSSICKKSYYKNIEKSKIYYELNREKLKKNRLNRYNNNKEIEKAWCKEYYKKNRSKLNKYRREYSKKRMEVDEIYKMVISIRGLISVSIRNTGYTKKSKTSIILGCSFEYFKIYIESKFEIWMNWSNHGKYTGKYNETWQLDHIIPISSAENEMDVIRLNHYTNFQPICSKQNNEKSNKII